MILLLQLLFLLLLLLLLPTTSNTSIDDNLLLYMNIHSVMQCYYYYVSSWLLTAITNLVVLSFVTLPLPRGELPRRWGVGAQVRARHTQGSAGVRGAWRCTWEVCVCVCVRARVRIGRVCVEGKGYSSACEGVRGAVFVARHATYPCHVYDSWFMTIVYVFTCPCRDRWHYSLLCSKTSKTIDRNKLLPRRLPPPQVAAAGADAMKPYHEA